MEAAPEQKEEVLKGPLMLYDPQYYLHCLLVLADRAPDKGVWAKGVVRLGLAQAPAELVGGRGLPHRELFAVECDAAIREQKQRMIDAKWRPRLHSDQEMADQWHEARLQMIRDTRERLLREWPKIRPVIEHAEGVPLAVLAGELEQATGLKCYSRQMKPSANPQITIEGWAPVRSLPAGKRPAPVDVNF